MSDDIGTNQWNTNNGVTLPGTSNATHNIKLAPLFFELSGYTIRRTYEGWEYVIMTQGTDGYLWSNVAASSVHVYYTGFGDVGTAPSSHDATIFGMPFRCLVSTTNS